MSDEFLLRVFQLLKKEYGDRGYLGKYEYLNDGKVSSVNDSIRIRHLHDRGVARRFMPGSGIEAVLEPLNEISTVSKLGNGCSFLSSIKLVLTQENPEKTVELREAIELLYRIPLIRPTGNPIVRSIQWIGEEQDGNRRSGYIPARSIVYLERSQW